MPAPVQLLPAIAAHVAERGERTTAYVDLIGQGVGLKKAARQLGVSARTARRYAQQTGTTSSPRQTYFDRRNGGASHAQAIAGLEVHERTAERFRSAYNKQEAAA